MQRLNPKNSLFGRILVWFWVAVTLMIVMAFFIARYFSQSWEISALEAEQLQNMEQLKVNLQNQLNHRGDIERTLRRTGGRSRLNLMVINMNTREFTFGFPPTLLTQKKHFLSLIEAQQPILVRTNNMEFAGPFLITSEGLEYQLFAGRLLRRDQRPIFAFGLSLFVFLLTGTIACVAIAWTIAKPIKQLSKLSKDFSAGLIEDSAIESSRQLKNRKDELGQLHNDIFHMASNLAKSLSQQKALMANISHELRTPLTRLQLALAMLNPDGEDQLFYANRIEKDIGVMDVLIGQALQLAKMGDDSQAQWMQMKTESLSGVLNPLFEDLEFEAKASGITLLVNKYEKLSLPLIQTSFVSAIENVTRNAIKYSKNTVQVTIEQHKTTSAIKDHEVSDNKNVQVKNMLSIKIEDDGEGLSDQQIAHIFEPFYRAPSGKKLQGTGLGLAIAKASVQLHKGEINAHGSPLGGLCVTMLFPFDLS